MEQKEYNWEELSDQDDEYMKENKEEYFKILKFFNNYTTDKEYEIDYSIHTTIYLTKKKVVCVKANECGEWIEEYELTQEKKDMIFKVLELLEKIIAI